MGILMWEKPEKIMTTESWRASHSSDCDVPGTYTPNMSPEDEKRWKARLIGKGEFARVEIRRLGAVVTVALGAGFGSKKEPVYKDGEWPPTHHKKIEPLPETVGVNVQIKTGRVIDLTWNQLAELNSAIKEAREALEKLAKG